MTSPLGLKPEETRARMAVIVTLTELRRLLNKKQPDTVEEYFIQIEEILSDLKFSQHKNVEKKALFKLTQKLIATSMLFMMNVLLEESQ